MYYPIGWPNILKLSNDFSNIHQVVCNRDKLLFAVLSDECLCIWLCKPCLRIVSHRRSLENIEDIGNNVLVEWRPDSSMLVVATSSGQLLFYSLTMSPEHKGLYEQQDPSNPNLKRESAELFVKEVIPSLVLKHVETITVSGGVTSLVCIRDELMVATVRGQILRYRWDGSVNRDYCLDLGRVPFCIDQQVSKAEPITESNIFVCHIEYSPLVGGFAAVLNDGRAAFLTAHSLQFDPNQVQGIWAQGLEDATCAALNHKHRLIAFGKKNSQCVVYCVDEATGALEVSHQVILSSKDFPGAPGAVSCLRWSPDGCAMALAWSSGGISLWSTFGSLLMCSLAWDHGLNSPLSRLRIKSMDWAAEGYQLWMAEGDNDKISATNNRVLKMEMVKSPLTVNPCMSQHGHVHLQGEDKLLVHPGFSRIKSTKPVPITKSPQIVGNAEFSVPLDTNSFSGSKQWVVVTIPHTYSSTNWPIRYTAVDADGQNVAIAGRMGFAHYSLLSRRWKLFGNETQEKDFVVTGGILWWRGHIILGCYNLVANRDEIRIYDQEARLDDSFAKVEPAEAQVLLLNCFRDQLVTFCADSHITLYALDINEASGEVDVNKVQVIDISAICVHPACVVSITLTCLRTESCTSSRRHTAESLIVNVSGRLLLVQRVAAQDGNDGMLLCAPTVLASCVESVWMPSRSRKDKLHLTEALWLYCGAHGMRVWLPLFPRDGDKAHTFMSKRIMLPFQLSIYPLAILFEDAILLGAENDTVLYSSDATSHFSLPFCVLQRTSQVYLHQILRQLIRRNLGYHAWEIARSCTNLPYFSHSLELLLHEVLEEEATSKEPIPDALLPSVVEFIHEFPVYLETVVQCARKTEVALWPYLFSAAGKPKELFQQCLNNQQLETAASYLLILQNLEACAVSRQYATLLLDTALQLSKWELAKDLIRFLRAIDPNDVETPRAAIASGVKFGMAQSPPLSPHEEDLSLVLGTMQVARGRSYSTTTTPKVTSSEPALSANNGSPHPRRSDVLVRSNSNIGDNAVIAVRKTSAPSAGSKRDSGAFSTDDFFIDNILQRHACRLLVHKQLKDLGQMAGHLDFHLVAWLRSVRDEAARIDNCITTIKTLHEDFKWPYPSDQWNPNCLPLHSTMRKASGSGSSGRSFPASPSVEDRLKALTLDILKGNPSRIQDPVSKNQSKPQSWTPLSSSELSPTTVEAKLQPHTIQEGSSLVSDESSSYLGEEGEAGEDVIHTLCWATSPDTDIAQDAASGRVPSKQEVQLRYLLQLFMEAGCLEWALVLSVILRDAMAVLRTTYAARSAEQPGDAVRRLKSCLEQLMEWSNTECLGYRPFMCAIQSQVSVLNKILLSEFENSSDKNTITSVSPSSSTSTLDKPQCATATRDDVTCDVPVSGRLRLVSCSSVGNSSLDSLQEEPSLNSSDTEKSENNLELQRESTSCIIS